MHKRFKSYLKTKCHLRFDVYAVIKLNCGFDKNESGESNQALNAW